MQTLKKVNLQTFSRHFKKLHNTKIANVTTWSHLATAFNSKPVKKFNLTKNESVILFSIKLTFLFK